MNFIPAAMRAEGRAMGDEKMRGSLSVTRKSWRKRTRIDTTTLISALAFLQPTLDWPPMTENHFKLQYADFSADLALGGDWSLYELAELIIHAVGFDFDHAFEFCDNLENPYRSKERYTLFADLQEGEEGPGVQKTLVSAVFKKKRKMIFHFDYGDDWFFLITCTDVKESDKKRRFRKVIATSGSPPVQYPDPDE